MKFNYLRVKRYFWLGNMLVWPLLLLLFTVTILPTAAAPRPLELAPHSPATPTTIVDTTPGTAVNDGIITATEYAGFSTGINNGFGDVIGMNSRLHIDSDVAGNLNLGLQSGGGNLNNFVVIYLDTIPGGFPDTTLFNDNADPHRAAISGIGIAGPAPADLFFGPNFQPDYAIAFDQGFAGLWQLNPGGVNSLGFVSALTISPTLAPAGGQWEINGLNLAMLSNPPGLLLPGSTFTYLATYLNPLDPSGAFRSDEFHGVAATSVPPGNPGFMPVILNPGDYNTFTSYLPNNPPNAYDNFYSGLEDNPILGNFIVDPSPMVDDDGGDGPAGLSVYSYTTPVSGTLAVNLDGSFIYTPTLNFNGPISFTYAITDGADTSNAATVTLDFVPENDPPVAVDDSYTVLVRTAVSPTTSVSGNVLANDTDPENDPLTALLLEPVVTGTLFFDIDGSFVYTPALDFTGLVTFTYHANDPHPPVREPAALSNPATVTINVQPQAVDDSYLMPQGGILQAGIAMTETATAVPAAPITDDGYDGSLSSMACSFININRSGQMTFAEIEAGIDHTWVGDLTIKLVNPGGSVLGLASRPGLNETADDGSDCCGDSANLSANFPLRFSDSGPTDAEIMGSTSTNTNLVICQDDGLCHYFPNPDTVTGLANFAGFTGETGIGPWQLCVGDNAGADTGVLQTWTLTTTLSSDGVLANDIEAATAVLAADVFTGALDLVANGHFTYTPPAVFAGIVTFTYQAASNGALSDPATVTITVNDPPTAVANSYNMVEDGTLNGNLISDDTGQGMDSDIVNSGLTIFDHTSPAVGGALVITPDGSFSYTPPTNFFGTVTFSYWLTDGLILSEAAPVTITVALGDDDPPVANNNSYGVTEDTTRVVGGSGVLGNDSDPDGDPLTAVLDNDVFTGTLELLPTGAFTYTPPLNFNGPVTFTYHATSTIHSSNVALVTLSVNGVEDPPVASDIITSTNEDTPINGLLNVTDPDPGDSFVSTVQNQTGPGLLTLNGASWAFTPTNRVSSYQSIVTVLITDTDDLTTTATLTITVSADNDPFTALDDTVTTDEDTVVTGTVQIIDPDSDDNYIFLLTTPPVAGFVMLEPGNGDWTYTPDNKEADYTAVFTVTVNDGGVLRAPAWSDTATITVSVAADNDTPIAQNDAYTLTTGTILTVTAPGVQANDSDVDSTLLTTTVQTAPVSGTLSLNAAGGFVYTATMPGVDSFVYQLGDGNTSDTGLVTLTIPANCFARVVSSGMVYESVDSSAVQTAVDNATPGDTIQIAGTCAGVQTVSGSTQAVRIDKDLTLRGGYDGADWGMTPDPDTYTTTLDAEGNGRVAFYDGSVIATLDNMRLMNGATVDSGGGIYVSGSSVLTITDTTIEHNQANNGGGILNQGRLRLSNSIVQYNVGRGITNRNSGVLTIDNSTLYSNTASTGAGIDNAATLTITHSLIASNISTATNTDGGGLSNSGAAFIAHTTFRGNQSGRQGGGSTNRSSGVMRIENGRFISNTAATFGGAFFNGGHLTIQDSTLSGNHANNQGGGLHMTGGVLTMTGSTLAHNTAGGGIAGWSQAGGTASGDNVTLSGNNPGGLRSWAGAQAITLTHASVISNTGIGVQRYNGSIALQASLIAANSSGQCDGTGITSLGYNLSNDSSCPFTATSDINNTLPLVGPLADNGGAAWTHALLPPNPAIDRIPPLSATHSLDQRGIVRPQGFNHDIGAYEYVGASNAVSPTLAISYTTAPTATLSWSGATANCTYAVSRSTAPYTGFSLWQENLFHLMLADGSALGNPATNYYYFVTATACGFVNTAVSNTVGAFDFALQPGN